MGTELKTILSLNGVDVTSDTNGLASLTALWRAAGSPEGKRPANWARKEGKGFIDHMAGALNVPHGHICKAGRGRGGETRAHWQIGIAYAKDLSHEIHEAVNEGFRRWYEEEKNPGLKIERGVAKYLSQGYTKEWVARRIDGITTRKELTATMADHNCRVNDKHDNPFAEATRSISLAVLGSTPKEIRTEKGLKKSQATRDHLTERDLTRLKFVESEAAHMIREEAADGNKQCVDRVRDACEAVKSVIRSIDQRSRPQPAA